MNCSFFIIDFLLGINFNLTSSIRELGKNLFGKDLGFSELINTINSNISVGTSSINVFSLDGLIKGTLTFSLLNLVFSYSFRYIMVKIFVLISPFAILTLTLNNTNWFFKSWIKNLFSLLFVQLIVSLVLLILFSMDYSNTNLFIKFLYIGGIYALIKANSFVREFIGGISTTVTQNFRNIPKLH